MLLLLLLSSHPLPSFSSSSSSSSSSCLHPKNSSTSSHLTSTLNFTQTLAANAAATFSRHQPIPLHLPLLAAQHFYLCLYITSTEGSLLEKDGLSGSSDQRFASSILFPLILLALSNNSRCFFNSFSLNCRKSLCKLSGHDLYFHQHQHQRKEEEEMKIFKARTCLVR